MFKKFAFSLLFISSTAYTASAQHFNKAKMDSLFDAINKHDKGMGSIAIRKGGKLVYARAIGYRAISGQVKTPANTDTKYRIGSITKMFTAVMIMQLAEEGKISLTDKLSKFYPEIPNAQSITITQLLNHHSGIHNFTDDSTYIQWNTTPHSNAEMLDIIAKGGSDFAPGAKGSYSNSNYVLLGYIIEKVTGEPYEAQLQKRIALKTGLKNTYSGVKTNPAENEAHSYSNLGEWKQEDETDMSIPGGAGTLLSTPSDLTLFITALFHYKLVSKESLDKMMAIKDGYGLGMFSFPFNDKRAYGHTGGIDGFSSSLGYFKSDSMAIAYISNGQVMATNDVMIGALSIYYNEPYKIPDFKTFEVSEAILKRYTGQYTSSEMPLNITVTMKGKTLYAQATGQNAFPLTAKDNTTFEFSQAGIIMTFDADKGTMVLNQAGSAYHYTRSK